MRLGEGSLFLETFSFKNAALPQGCDLERAFGPDVYDVVKVVREGQIVIRPMMNYNLTYDHRVVMGQDANRFEATLQQLVEEPYLLLL